MDVPLHLHLPADPVSGTPSNHTVAHEAADEVDVEIRKLQLHIGQAEHVHATMTAKIQQLEKRLGQPKDEQAARGEEQVGQDGEIREGRDKAGREKGVEGVWGEDEGDAAGGRAGCV